MNNRVKVEDYYQDELFKFMPEDMFNILDEASFYNSISAFIPECLLKSFNQNQKNEMLIEENPNTS